MEMGEKRVQRNRPPPLSLYEVRRILNPVRKWRVATGALVGAALLSGIEVIGRGIEIDWDFLSDSAQELLTLEILMPGILIGAVCGSLVCLIRNQQRRAKDEDE
jgi:hypothetical protein